MEKTMKIIAGIEPIDPHTGVNLPNSCNPNYYKEDSLMKYPLTLGSYMFQSTFGEGDLSGYYSLNNSNYNCIRYKLISEINENYLYIISVYSTTYFINNKEFGFKFISAKVLDDIRNGTCQLVFVNSTEGMSGINGISQEFDFLIIENWCNEYNISTDSVHYIHGNLLSKERAISQGCSYHVYPVTTQECWNYIDNYPSSVSDFNPIELSPYLYLSYNRQPRFHRVLLLSILIKEKLFNLGINSFNKMDSNIQWFENIFRKFDQLDYYDNVKELFNLSPIVADCDNTNIKSSVGDLKNYDQTFISVVTETLTNEGTLFCSEKTWRSIIVGHPFIILSSKGVLSYLKSQGFKTFSQWINEDYDNIDNEIDRIKFIVNELKRLSQFSLDQLRRIREEMKPTLVYNKQLMRQRVADKYLFENNKQIYHNIYQPVEDILIEISKHNSKR